MTLEVKCLKKKKKKEKRKKKKEKVGDGQAISFGQVTPD
jgi:hypothetical protein